MIKRGKQLRFIYAKTRIILRTFRVFKNNSFPRMTVDSFQDLLSIRIEYTHIFVLYHKRQEMT